MNDHEGDAKGRPALGWSISPLPLAMRGQAGAAAPVGLALAIRDDAFSIEVIGPGDRAILTLGPYSDDDVVAVWRSLAACSGLPLLLRDADDRWQQPYPQLGRLLIGRRSDRRRLTVLSGRRPRFLCKRKSARLPRRPLVHREREIVGGRSDRA